MTAYNVLMMGASYGSLLATKLLFGGHKITLVCLPAEIEAFNSDGARVRMPIRGRKDPIELNSRKLPGSLPAAGPGEVDPADYDLVVLAMQEPQYRSPGVRELLDAVARAKVPCMSIMNMPPLPYLKRIPGLATDALKPCYTDAERVGQFRARAFDVVQPGSAGDPPARRKDQRAAGDLADKLQGGALCRRRRRPRSCGRCRRRSRRSATIRAMAPIDLPVKLKVHESIFVPLAKWAMLLTGNYRCVHAGRARSTSRTPCTAISRASRSVYNWVCGVCEKLGASPDDLVPFEKYAAAAQRPGAPVLGRPRARSTARPTSSGPTGWCRRSARSSACAIPSSTRPWRWSTQGSR